MAYTDTPFLDQRPKCIALVGLGPSANAYWLECATWNNQLPWESVWVVNRASSAFRHDATWNVHDLRRLVQEAPTEELRLMKADKPILTPKAYPEFPMSVEIPAMDILNFVKQDNLSSGPAWMLAYAMMIGVKTIYLYGMDFHYPNVAVAEEGGQGFAYLLGQAQMLNIDFKIPNSSSLLSCQRVVLVASPKLNNGQVTPMRPLYGYVMEGLGPRDPRVPEGSTIQIVPQPPGFMTPENTPRGDMPKGAERGDVVTPSADGGPVPSPALAEVRPNPDV